MFKVPVLKLTIIIITDLIQEIFDPVVFSDRVEADEELRTYMMFTQFLTELEGS